VRLREIDLHFHDLRHEAGSRKLEAGWPLHAVSRWLGHSKLTTTDTYLNATTRLLHALNERVSLRAVK
jgi:integrase